MLEVLSYQAAVPRQYVHRQSVAEVFLTDSVPEGRAGGFRIGAQWPRLHAFYRTCTQRYDTMILAETARQSAIYLAHRYYRVPLDRKFTMQSMMVDACVDRLMIGHSAAEVVLEAQMTEHDRRRGQLTAFTVDLVYRLGNTRIGSARATANILTRDDYDSARWPGDRDRSLGTIPRSDPAPRSEVGVADPSAVTLGRHPAGPNGGRWRLRVDTSHPVLFDHPCDHVPGALVLEASRQASRLRLGWPCADVESITVRFRRFLELDEPTTVIATPRTTRNGCVDVTFDQWGLEKASGTVQLVMPASPDHDCGGVHRACK
jgi:hypothetical protein